MITAIIWCTSAWSRKKRKKLYSLVNKYVLGRSCALALARCYQLWHSCSEKENDCEQKRASERERERDEHAKRINETKSTLQLFTSTNILPSFFLLSVPLQLHFFSDFLSNFFLLVHVSYSYFVEKFDENLRWLTFYYISNARSSISCKWASLVSLS